MAKKEKKDSSEKLLLKDAIKLYGDKNGYVFIHKHNVFGDFEYKVSEISEKLLENEVICVQRNTGGLKHKYSAITYIIK